MDIITHISVTIFFLYSLFIDVCATEMLVNQHSLKFYSSGF
jgi:hypothetical protein